MAGCTVVVVASVSVKVVSSTMVDDLPVVAGSVD